MQEWVKKNGKVVHICSTCENEKHMSGDLSDCICADCGSDNGWNKFKLKHNASGNNPIEEQQES